MQFDLWMLYTQMLKSRLFEEAVTKLWHEGLISGEMHLGTGEEAIIAGVVTQLQEGDAMALDHRGTAALLMRGVDPVLILREMLGYTDGLCGGRGGHMHLFSKEHLAASSGIVGTSGPTAAGFALAAQYLRPGTIALSFFGEGAVNQGMLMESFNLAAVWNLPVLFVCKDDGWSITSESQKMTGGNISERVRGFGLPVVEVNGRNVAEVWEASRLAIEHVRSGRGPFFLKADCVHLEGHFLGFQLLRMVRKPIREMPAIAVPLTQSFLRPGGAELGERLAGLKNVLGAVFSTLRDGRKDSVNDPVKISRETLLSDPVRLQEIENQIGTEINQILDIALKEELS